MPEYGEAKYWDERYAGQSQQDDFFEWYVPFASMQDLITSRVRPEDSPHVLMIGCGNSKLTFDMIQHGYKSIHNIDISPIVIAQMKDRSANLGRDGVNVDGISWAVADARNMSDIQSSSCDLVIDKGTLDALLCGENSIENSKAVISEICRVTKKGGCAVFITYGAPSERLYLFSEPSLNWSTQHETISKNASVYHIYLCVKRGQSREDPF